MIYLQLFISYLKIGFFGFGGGYAMLSLIQNEIVEQRGWITVAGFWGSVVATVAVCLPALTVMLALTKFFLKLKDNRYVHGTITGMRPVVVGMIAAAALLLIFPKEQSDSSFIDHWSWLLFGLTLYVSHKKVNPILLIALSALAGILIYGV